MFSAKSSFLYTVCAMILFLMRNNHAAVFETELNKFVMVTNSEGKNIAFVLKFDLPTNLEGSIIDLTEISLQFKGDSCLSDYLNVTVHPLSIPLVGDIVSVGSEVLKFDESYMGARSLKFSQSEWTDIRIDDLVTAWNSKTVPNLGLMVRILESECDNLHLQTSDGTPLGIVAKLRIFYTKPEVKK